MPRHRPVDFDQVISDTLAASEFRRVESPLSKRIFKVFFAATLTVLMIFLGRVVFLAGIRGSSYEARADENLNQQVPLIAPRGIILDRNGEPLVKNEAVFSVFLHVAQMVKNNEQDAVLATARDILGVGEDQVLNLIRGSNLESISDIIIATDVNREQAIQIQSLDLESLAVEQSYERSYIDPAYAHVVGYVGLVSSADLRNDDKLVLNDSIGRNGLELYYDDSLRGKNGRVSIYRDSSGKVEEISRTREPLAGADLRTSIDIGLQNYFYSSMLAGLRNLNRTSGVGIAIDPRNGELLAIVSLPSYDGNDVSPSLGNVNEPLFNRAISGLYNPGSTIKPFHAAAALQEGIISPTKQIFSAGYIDVPNPYDPAHPSRFVDWKVHGWVDIYAALARSSNVYFYTVGGGFGDQIGLGVDRLHKYWEKFGLAKPSGIDLPSEAVGFLPSPEEKEARTNDIWRIGDTYNVSIGQGDLAITPIRLLTAVAAISNDGVAYRPHLSLAEEPQVLLDLGDMTTALKEVERGMRDAVTKDYGTANLLQTNPMYVAAKTGSAQVASNTKTNALFIGYAARSAEETPEIAVLVLIEDAREGSLNAVPIARDVMQWYYENRVLTDGEEN